MAAIGALSVDLTANTALFKRDLNKARRLTRRSTGRMLTRFRGLERGIGRTFSMVGKFRGAIVALAAAGGLTLLVKRSIESADAIAKVADKVGVGTEALQQLRFAAEQAAAVNATTLDMALQRFSRRVGEAAQGSGELTGTLKQYGIEVKNADGSTRAVTDVLGDLAEAIKGADSNQEKLRISFKAFDSEGAALVNLMNQGREGIQRYADEAERLGIILSDRTVRAAERANEQFGRMQQIVGVNLTRGMISLSPLIIRLGNAFAEAAPKIRTFLDRFLPQSLRGPKSLRKELTGLQGELRILAAAFDVAKASGDLTPFLAKNEARIESLMARIWELKTSLAEAEKTEGAIGGGLNIGIGRPGHEKILDSIRRRNRALAFEKTLVGKSRAEKEKMRATESALILARTSNVTLTREHISALQMEAGKVGVLTGELEGLERQQARNEQMARDFGQAFASAMTSARTEGEKFSDTLRNMAANLVRLYAQRQLEESITGLFGSFNLGRLFSGGGGGGSGSLAATVNTPVANFAQGGSFMVGGSGGTDSQKVAFNASPNERVTIETPAQQRRGGGDTYIINAPGADAAGLARLESMIRGLHGSIEQRSVAAVVDASQRNPRLLAAGI